MIKIIVGSKNPIKIQAVAEAFGNYFADAEVTGMDVVTGVPDQPFNDETFIGAENRARALFDKRKTIGNHDYYAGIEGGIIRVYNSWFALGCICLMNDKGEKSFGTSALFQLPDAWIERLKAGMELGHLIDEVAGDKNSKQKNGAIGYLTQNVLTRKDIYIEGVITALIPFLNDDIYSKTR